MTAGMPVGEEGRVYDLGDLYIELDKVTDRRRARGKRYCLALVLLLIILAKMAGQDRPYAMADWISAHATKLISMLGLTCQRLFCLNTLRRVLQDATDLEELQETVCRFLCQGSPRRGHSMTISIDGKVLRGSLALGQDRGLYLLVAYLPEEGVVLLQVAVESNESELTVVPRLLQALDLRGKVVTADALFTQRALSVQIVEAGGDYLWLAKENQPRLLEAIAQLFAPQTRTPGWGVPRNDFQKATSSNKGHGRLERRTITTSELLNDYLDWPYVGQVFRLERQRTRLKDGRQETEGVYGLTSLCRHEADARRLLQLVRGHWGIENGLFYRRDATLHEDATRMTNPALARAMSIINNLVLGLIIQQGWRYVPEARRRYSAHPHEALALLVSSPT
jgi:predicted transposase YbfD/YdcC